MDRSQQTHLLKLFHFGKLTDVVHSANTVAQTTIWVELLKHTKAKKYVKQWKICWEKNGRHSVNMHRHSVASADLDDVSRNDKLGGFSVTLFVRRTLCTEPKDPLHLVLETLLAWLFIHGPA